MPRGTEMLDAMETDNVLNTSYDASIAQIIRMQVDVQEDSAITDQGDEDEAEEDLPQVLAVDGRGEGFYVELGDFGIEIPQVDGDFLTNEEDLTSDCDESLANVIVCGEDVPDGDANRSQIYVNRFRKYVKFCQQNMADFEPKEVFAIKMLDALRRKRATLDTYETLIEVFFKHWGVIGEHETLKDTPEYIGRQTLMKKLAIRYGVVPHKRLEEDLERKLRGHKKNKNMPYYLEKSIVLPHSKAKVDVIYFDFRQQLVSLLTDPRLKDEHFCHHGNNPLEPPPTSFTTVGEIITGLAYRKTYNSLITSPDGQMVMPVTWYVDGTSTGQFTDLKVEGVKFSLGFLTNEVRSWK
jgi:hypothetical protein